MSDPADTVRPMNDADTAVMEIIERVLTAPPDPAIAAVTIPADPPARCRVDFVDGSTAYLRSV